VIITSRKSEGPNGLDQALKKLNETPNINGRAVAMPADVSKTSDIGKLVNEIKKTDGRLDILVANAGTSWGGSFDTTPDSSVAKVLDLNVRGVFNLIRQ
jgi:NAD(P)-dependent dehydrogenase (short-subunit alcohol dehydrogenase family)